MSLSELASARDALDVELGLLPAGVAAICFKPPHADEYVRSENETQAAIDAAAPDARIERRSDDLGFEWLVVRDPELESLAATVGALGTELAAREAKVLAAIFPFKGGKKGASLIYDFGTQTFWPFVPAGEKERDNDEELAMKSKLENKLSIEGDVSRWFALYDAPV